MLGSVEYHGKEKIVEARWGCRTMEKKMKAWALGTNVGNGAAEEAEEEGERKKEWGVVIREEELVSWEAGWKALWKVSTISLIGLSRKWIECLLHWYSAQGLQLCTPKIYLNCWCRIHPGEKWSDKENWNRKLYCNWLSIFLWDVYSLRAKDCLVSDF